MPHICVLHVCSLRGGSLLSALIWLLHPPPTFPVEYAVTFGFSSIFVLFILIFSTAGSISYRCGKIWGKCRFIFCKEFNIILTLHLEMTGISKLFEGRNQHNFAAKLIDCFLKLFGIVSPFFWLLKNEAFLWGVQNTAKPLFNRCINIPLVHLDTVRKGVVLLVHSEEICFESQVGQVPVSLQISDKPKVNRTKCQLIFSVNNKM